MTVQRLYHFSELDPQDTLSFGVIGKKFAALHHAKLPIHNGFLIAPHAYFEFLKENKLDTRIKKLLTTLDFALPETLLQMETHIKKMFAQASFAPSFVNELNAYLLRIGEHDVSYTSYSLEPNNPIHTTADAETLNELLVAIKHSWADHFSATLLAHRNKHALDHLTMGLVGIVQIHVQPDKQGKVLTSNPDDPLHHTLVIKHHREHGTDTYIMSKKNKTIVDRTITPHPKGYAPLTLPELENIAALGVQIENHLYFPQELDWALKDGELLLLHTKPLAEHVKPLAEKPKKHAVSRGIGITKSIATGTVHIITNPQELEKLGPHDIVVMEKLIPNLKTHLTKIRGIVTEKAQFHSELTALLRRYNITTIMHVPDATRNFKNGTIITLHAGTGEIYNGGYLQ